jgi:hypothetical protein
VPPFVARTPPPAPPPAPPAPSPRATPPPAPPAPPTGVRRRPRPRWGRIAAAAAVVAGVAVLTGIGMSGDAESSAPDPALGLPGLTPAAAREIPAGYLRLYVRFGREMDIDWRFLAAIGGQESDHGRHPAAARVNRAGCVGPMQLGVGGSCGDFVGAWGVDGDGDGRVNPLTPADAIATAANGLRHGKGAPATGGPYLAYRRAACGYYGACADSRVDYADDVMARAVRYGFPPR